MDIIGHEAERTILRKAAGSARPPQAVLLSGPAHIGKALVAAEYAELLAGAGSGRPTSDILVLAHEGDPGTENMLDLSVESVREARAFLSRTPFSGRFRVVIVRDADRMNASAQNAFLKTLEEPYPSAAVILVADNAGAILPTIRSRVFAIRLHPPREAAIRDGLRRSFGDEADALEPYFIALRRPGICVRAILDPDAFAARRERLRGLFRISKLTPDERSKLSAELAEDPAVAAETLEWWLAGLRVRAGAETDPARIAGYYRILDRIGEVVSTLRTVPVNARLQIDALLFPLAR